MVLADDAEAIERVGADDEQQSQEHIGHQPERPQRAAYRHSGGDEENATRRESDIGERSAGERSQENSGEDARVGKRDDGAAPVGWRSPLENSVQRHEDEGAEDSEESQYQKRSDQLWRQSTEQKQCDGRTHGSQWDQSVFNPVLR